MFIKSPKKSLKYHLGLDSFNGKINHSESQSSKIYKSSMDRINELSSKNKEDITKLTTRMKEIHLFVQSLRQSYGKINTRDKNDLLVNGKSFNLKYRKWLKEIFIKRSTRRSLLLSENKLNDFFRM